MGKHFIKTKQHKNGKFKKSYLLLFSLFLIIIICCIHIGNIKEKNFSQQEKIIQTFFCALKELNIEEVNKYADYNSIISGLDESILNYKESEELEKNLFNTIEWSIESIKEEDGKILAVIEVKNKNYKNIITQWLREIVDLKLSAEKISEEESLKVLNKILKNNSYDTKSIIKKIQIIEQEEEFRILVNDDLINLLYPGIENINDIL